MPGARRTYTLGPSTYEVSEAVAGGQLVMAGTSGDAAKVKVATAGAATVIGVALAPAAPVAAPADPLLMAPNQPEVAVACAPANIVVGYTTTTAFGVLVKAGATGTVVPWVSGTDAAGLIVGRCSEPGGVTVSSGTVEGHLRLGW